MSAGEEITYSYRFAFNGATTEERQQALAFDPKCNVCTLSLQMRLFSDMRRRLIRGLQILSRVFGDGKYSAVIIDPVLRERGEMFEIPLSSKPIYKLLIILLLEQEGLLTDVLREVHITFLIW